MDSESTSRRKKLEKMKHRIALGMEASAQGEVMDADEFFDQLLRETEEETKANRKR